MLTLCFLGRGKELKMLTFPRLSQGREQRILTFFSRLTLTCLGEEVTWYTSTKKFRNFAGEYWKKSFTNEKVKEWLPFSLSVALLLFIFSTLIFYALFSHLHLQIKNSGVAYVDEGELFSETFLLTPRWHSKDFS